MKHRIAFAGFRHPHIFALLEAVQGRDDCEIVAACEEDSSARQALEKEGEVELTHDSFAQMISSCSPGIVAIGDYYSIRGSLLKSALQAGCHVISDKPICTTMRELDSIEAELKSRSLCLGCQLDLRNSGAILRLREIVLSGEIGEVCTVTIMGQHPLRMGVRPSWYFEPGCHGGTINDIGIHAFDVVPWMTGQPWENLLSARQWNRKAKRVPHFKDCAQFHGLLADGASVFVDVSYLAPDNAGFGMPQYWRILVHGTVGMAETNHAASGVILATDSDAAPRLVPSLPPERDRYLNDFLDEIAGRPSTDGLTTKGILSAARFALQAQELSARS